LKTIPRPHAGAQFGDGLALISGFREISDNLEFDTLLLM
jgi:hypothetical protein